jgi:choline transport protein
MLLGLINIGSSVAFNAIVSMVVATYFGSYFIPISMVAYRRIKGMPLELGPWNLGRLGLFANIVALIWIIVTWTFSFFPIAVPVTPQTMNWSSVLWGAVMIFGISWYFAYQRRRFTGPTVISGRFDKI